MNDDNKIKIPVILGATAVGKTDLALEIAARYGYEILSCDSRQIYKGMDIGTAKPTREQAAEVKHHLIDILEPDVAYSAFAFAEDAKRVIKNSHECGKKILICGGTGLYYHILSGEYAARKFEVDLSLREELTREAEKFGSVALHDRLKNVNPDAAKKIHANDLQRIILALDVYYQNSGCCDDVNHENNVYYKDRQKSEPTEVKSSEEKTSVKKITDESLYDFNPIIITREREELYNRINKRVDVMFDMGLYEEFLSLVDMGYSEKSPGLATPGYRELFDVRKGVITKEQAAELIKQNTRRYAKRQMTWFRNKLNAVFIDADSPKEKFINALSI